MTDPIHAIMLSAKPLYVMGFALAAFAVCIGALQGAGPSRPVYRPIASTAPAVSPAVVHLAVAEQTAGPMLQPVPARTSQAAFDQLVREQQCLAQAMYYEARGEGPVGERAVAEVILHRLVGGQHGASICEVVYEGSQSRFCQFTFICDGSLNKPRDPADWQKAEILAAFLLSGQWLVSDTTNGATNYHATYVSPKWRDQFDRVARIGKHVFYRDNAQNPPLLVNGLRESLE